LIIDSTARLDYLTRITDKNKPKVLLTLIM